MCGIYGSVGEPDWLGRLRPENAVASMAHRGPDGSGIWRSPTLGLPGGGPAPACVLGHTRLSIIDLSAAGAQPMVSPDGRYALVYNGEVYNFRDIRRDLESLGDVFTSTGDTEVVFRACVRWGVAAPPRFRGMFALGLWDEAERTLLLARDRTGIKPLYMSRNGKGLSFASEVRTLLAAGAARRVLSPRGLLGYMRFGASQEPDTLLADVESLPPGSVRLFGPRGESSSRFAEPYARPAARLERREAVEELRGLLHSAVRRQLVSDVPFGVFLSGGVDSAALTALASEEATTPIHTFTVVFDEAAFSEERWGAEVADRFGCVHHSVRVSGADAAADLEEALQSQDQPSGDGLNSWLVSRAARREGLSMALSGLGGDEVFAGYSNFRHFAAIVSASRTGAFMPGAVLARLGRAASGPAVPNRLRKAVALAAAGGRRAGVYRALRCLFTDAQAEGLMPGPAFRRAIEADTPAPESLSSGDAVNDFSCAELEGYMRNTLLRDTDAMSMANSLEVRVPLLDEAVVDFMLSVPGRIKLDPAVNKPLLLEAVPSIPSGIGRRPKRGFVLPLEDWFRGPMRPGLERLIVGLPGPAAGVLRRPATTATWEAFLDGHPVSAPRIWALSSLASWISRNDVILPW